jgi:alpha-D-glucose phosphate-specific phosphoglucomutase
VFFVAAPKGFGMDNADADPISFGTDGWRATLSTFTEQRVRMVGQAVATYLADEGVPGGVAIGYDARDHSRGFAEELARVVAANGRTVTIAERDCPTPTLAWTVADGELAGGLMITASHNPPEYNGVKFVTASGAPALPGVTDAIEARLEPPDPAETHASIIEADLVEAYVDHVLSFADTDLSGLQIAYDAFHGSGRGVTDDVLEQAGATVARFRTDRDVTFGNVAPEPGPKTAETIRTRVASGDADLGLINDGDADRVGIVTPEHGYLDPNHVLALVYDFLLEDDAGDVVRTVSTSSLVDRIAASHGQSVHQTAVGFKWIAEAMMTHDALAGGEESGGYGVPEHLPNKDGILVGLLACAAECERPIDDRIDAILAEHGPIVQDRISVECPDAQKEQVIDSLEAELPDSMAGVAVDSMTTVDGFKLELADGTWILMRPSGTEPKLRIYAEAQDSERTDSLLAAGRNLVEPLIDVDG